MNEIKRLTMPFDRSELARLRTGDGVLLDGTMLVFRDAGHKRLFESIKNGKPDFPYEGETVYFMGPCPPIGDQVIGSCGPTTSCRMDKYTPYMFDHGLAAQIGKGKRSPECLEAMVRNGGVYFAAIGGAGALYSGTVTAAETVCYEDLGTEAVRRITVKDFPAIVAVDCAGNCIYND